MTADPRTIRLDQFETCARARNVLRNEGIVSLGDLASRTEEDLLRTPNFGRRSLADLKAILNAHGLDFADPIPPIKALHIIHPVLAVLEVTMLAWTGDRAQAAAQARLCAMALVHAGLLPDAQIINGSVVVRQDNGDRTRAAAAHRAAG